MLPFNSLLLFFPARYWIPANPNETLLLNRMHDSRHCVIGHKTSLIRHYPEQERVTGAQFSLVAFLSVIKESILYSLLNIFVYAAH